MFIISSQSFKNVARKDLLQSHAKAFLSAIKEPSAREENLGGILCRFETRFAILAPIYRIACVILDR